MKKFIAAVCGLFLLVSCGVGTYTVSSGKPDEGMISFVKADKESITVIIDDDNSYEVKTVKTKEWQKAAKKIKKTAQNTIYVSPGQHTVVVKKGNREVYNKKIFISTQEHKIIELH